MKDTLITWKKILFLVIALVICFYTYVSYSTSTPFPPKLPEDHGISPVNTSSSLKTPEYIIVRANEESTFSSETTGKIIYLPLKEGSSFTKGEILLKLDCRLQVAELRKAKAQQYSAYKALQSARKLKTYGAISEFEFIKTKADADSANAETDKLASIVDKCTIVAPFNGGITEIKVHLYETVKPGDPLLKVMNVKDLAIEVQVPSKWLAWLHIDSLFRVYINDLNTTIQSSVSYINPAIEPISQTVKITGKILQPPLSLKPGMTGQAFFNDNPESKKGNKQ